LAADLRKHIYAGLITRWIHSRWHNHNFGKAHGGGKRSRMVKGCRRSFNMSWTTWSFWHILLSVQTPYPATCWNTWYSIVALMHSSGRLRLCDKIVQIVASPCFEENTASPLSMPLGCRWREGGKGW